MTQTRINGRASGRHPDADAIARPETVAPGPDPGEPDEDDSDELLPGETPATAILIAPTKVSVVLKCPTCGELGNVRASLFARVTRDSDGNGALALRTKAPKVAHLCDQETLGLAEADRVR